jgi:hypothetical protein
MIIYTSKAARRLLGRAIQAQRKAGAVHGSEYDAARRILFADPAARRLARRAFRAQCKADRRVVQIKSKGRGRTGRYRSRGHYYEMALAGAGSK